jgi:hypothetical protein
MPAAPAPNDADLAAAAQPKPAASAEPRSRTTGDIAAKNASVPAAKGVPTPADQPAAAAAEGPTEQDKRSRRAWNLRRFTSSRRPDTPEREASAARDVPVGASLDRLTKSIESVTETLGGQSPEFYERELPQIAADEIAKRVRADVIVLLLDNGQGVMEVSGEVGLPPDERHLSVQYNRDVMRELFRTGVGLIEDTDRVRGALAGIPGSQAETLIMVPLVQERLGFGVLMAGRARSQSDEPTEVFIDTDVEALMAFTDAVASSLRTVVLLRHLKGQLRALEGERS